MANMRADVDEEKARKAWDKAHAKFMKLQRDDWDEDMTAKARSAEERARSAAAQDEHAWSRFAQSGGEAPIRAADVPWPTLTAAALGLDPRLTSAAERKQAFRAASLRWHPDKFLQSYGARLVPEERDDILKRVTEVSQEINSLYSAA